MNMPELAAISLLTDPSLSARQRLPEMLRQVLDAHAEEHRIPNFLFDAGRHALGAPGKMLRARMLLEACQAVSGNPEHIMYAAAATEFGHLASLVHDDIIDQDPTRRGRESIWGKFGTDIAIVSGDLFIFEAYYCLAMCRGQVPGDLIARALEVTSKGCIEMCLGQALEAELIGNCSATPDLYWAVVLGKTASLFRAACESGAILGGGTDQQIAAMRSFGECVGLAYQVVDDVLSYTTDQGRLGKPTASDVRNRRVTLPVLYALQDATPADAEILRSIFGSEPATSQSVSQQHSEHQQVTRVLERTGALTRAGDDAIRLHQQAFGHVLELPPSQARDALAITSTEAVRRNS